jgi:Tfp pilus assembly protein PilN
MSILGISLGTRSDGTEGAATPGDVAPLTAGRLAHFPRVNLLPPEIEEARRFRRVQAGLGAAVAGTVVVVGLLYALASGQAADAQTELDAATARHTALQQKASEYANVPAVYAQVAAAKAQVGEAMGQEVRWSFFLNDLSLKIPQRVWVTSMNVTQNVAAAGGPGTAAAAQGAGAGDANPLATAGIGQVTFEGNAMNHNDVASWLDSLARQHGYADPYFTMSEKTDIGDHKVAHYQSSVTLTDEALSGRYTEKAGK